MSAEANIALVRTAVEIMNTQWSAAMLERYDEYFTDDFRWTPALVGNIEGRKEYRGRDGLADYWRDFEASFSDGEFRDLALGSVGEDTIWIAATAHLRGAESGVPVEQRIGVVLRFEGGKLAEGQTFFSAEEAQATAEQWARA